MSTPREPAGTLHSDGSISVDGPLAMEVEYRRADNSYSTFSVDFGLGDCDDETSDALEDWLAETMPDYAGSSFIANRWHSYGIES